jgi:endonuclease YncB( thermonuclease family)
VRESDRYLRLAASGLLALVGVGALVVVASFDVERLSGRARVIDGDTLDVAGQRVRLEGIDAPESGQKCRAVGGESWHCGAAASKALSDLIGDRSVACVSRGRDKYDRVLASCFAAGRELNQHMVRSGLAWAFQKYSSRYVAQEEEARAARRGVWQAETDPAWVYRARGWEGAQASAPGGCAIKGNVTKHGRIYHMPWSPWYAKVRVEAAKGERWFCTEAEAAEAGFRASRAY